MNYDFRIAAKIIFFNDSNNITFYTYLFFITSTIYLSFL